jgi:hexosaminidase
MKTKRLIFVLCSLLLIPFGAAAWTKTPLRMTQLDLARQMETTTFLSNYVADLCEIFTGPYFHVGFDEAWNSGTCPVCREKERNGECFAEAIAFAHGLLKKHGKRMMMWDDFFGFQPGTLEKTPKDVVLFHWSYDKDISDRGIRFNFAGRFREDALANLPAKGYDVVPCSWFTPGNVRSFVSYARRHPIFGYLQTQWENTERFQGVNLPHVVAVRSSHRR